LVQVESTSIAFIFRRNHRVRNYANRFESTCKILNLVASFDRSPHPRANNIIVG